MGEPKHRTHVGLAALIAGALAHLPYPHAAVGAQTTQQPDMTPVEQTETPTFRAGATLPTVDAVVTDRQGRHVTDLTAGDFEVLADGKRRTVRHAVYVPVATEQRMTAAARQRQPSTILYSAPETTRVIAIVVDDLGLSFESTASVRGALRRYIDEQVQDGDQVAILRTSGGIGALQQFTSDRRLMQAAVDRVQWTILSRSGITPFAALGAPGSGSAESADERSLEGRRNMVVATMTVNALEYVVRGVEHLPGRKAVVFFSEGFRLLYRPGGSGSQGDDRTWSAFRRLMDRANSAGVVVYAIDARGLATGGFTAEDNPAAADYPRGGTGARGSGADGGDWASSPTGAGADSRGDLGGAEGAARLAATGRQPPRGDLIDILRSAQRARMSFLIGSQQTLHYLAEQTGGFAVVNNNDLNMGLRRVLDDLQGYYLLGYDAPEADVKPWEPGRVTVRVKRRGLRVRARGDRFGPSQPGRQREPSRDPLSAAVASPFGAPDIPVRLTSLFGYEKAGGSYLRALLFIDPNHITFTRLEDGRHEARLEVGQLAISDTGMVAENSRRTLSLSLTDERLRDVRARGLVYSTRMAVPSPGAYHVRLAARDERAGTLGSASQFVEVPEVGRGRLALSAVLLEAVDDTQAAGGTAPNVPSEQEGLAPAVLGKPSVRIFEPGRTVVYACEVYDGLASDKSQALLMSTTLMRGNTVVYRGEPTRLGAATSAEPLRVIPTAGRLSLGADMPRGMYTLLVTVHDPGDKKRVARQWVDFEVR